MSTPHLTAAPNPALVMQALNAYQTTYALKGAIDLGIFTYIADGATTVAEIAGRAQASERGVRILCDYLTIIGFLTKTDGVYGLSPTSAVFLNQRSPAYMGTAANFLAHDFIISCSKDMAGAVRKGGSVHDEATMAPEHPVWVEFARSMGSFTGMSGDLVAKKAGPASKVLDISAGHGMFGICVAKQNPAAQLYAQDWGNVLEVAKENAAKHGVAERFHTIPGSAFDVDLGSGYDLVLLPNFLHHFDPLTNVTLLKRVRASMAPGGRVATVEFVPNEDRVSPPMAASFSLQMLGGTPSGDAFTYSEYEKMFADAGFSGSQAVSLDPMPQTLILTAY
jgi:hypothetical protein